MLRINTEEDPFGEFTDKFGERIPRHPDSGVIYDDVRRRLKMDWKDIVSGFTLATVVTLFLIITVHGWIEVLPYYWPF
jgi:hypothetical protein